MKKLLKLCSIIFITLLFFSNFSLASANTSENGITPSNQTIDPNDPVLIQEELAKYSKLPEPSGQPEKPKNNSIMALSSYQGFTMKAGDIFITNGTSYNGLTGHSAIATTDNYILDAPGYTLPNGKNTTRQSTLASWIQEYTASPRNGTVWVYRVPSKYDYVAQAAGTWADRHYYSTTGSATQNIFPAYSVTLALHSTDPTYCSKIIYQAYYEGSGSLPFMIPKLPYDLVAPYSLTAPQMVFQAEYLPTLVKTFN